MRRPAGLSVPEFLEHQHAAALADHEPVAVAVVGTRRRARVVVAPTRGVQHVERHGLARAEFLGAAAEHHVLVAVLDRLVREADALAARGAGRRGRDDAAAQAEEDADVGPGRVRHHPHVGVGVQSRRIAGEQHLREVADVRRAADGRAAGDADAARAQQRVAEQSRVGQRELGGPHRQLRHAAHAAQLLAAPVLRRRESLDRRRQPGVEILVDIPRRHRAHGVAACTQPRLDGRPVRAQGTEARHARHDHAAHQQRPPLTAITWRVT